jgi:hypothetical protein
MVIYSKMTDHYARLWLKDLFQLVPGAKDRFQETAGINPDEAPLSLLRSGIEVMVENEQLQRKHNREDIIREQEHEFQAKLEQAKAEALRYSISEAAKIIRDGNKEDAERLEKILLSINEGAKQLAASNASKGGGGSTQTQTGNYSPSLISYMNCWRKHDPTPEHLEGRPGPSQCVQVTPYADGTHYRCMVAFAAQSPDAFARTGYQVFHAELLRQGDCPRPLSRNISRRIPIVSWTLTNPDTCPLATGKEYKLGVNERLVEVTR